MSTPAIESAQCSVRFGILHVLMVSVFQSFSELSLAVFPCCKKKGVVS